MTDIITLNVDPQDLINTSEMFQEEGTQISSLTSEMMNLVVGLSSVWSGDASTGYISKFQQLEDDIERMISMISEHVSDLVEMASNYNAAETFGMEALEVLSTDVII